MKPIRSATRLLMIETGGRWCRWIGLPRSTGQIYGLLFLWHEPLNLDGIAELLGISKAATSMGARQLRALGVVRQTWLQGDRRDYYEVVDDLPALLRTAYREFLTPRILASKEQIATLEHSLEQEVTQGMLSPQECRVCSERLKRLGHLRKKMEAVTSVMERLL